MMKFLCASLSSRPCALAASLAVLAKLCALGFMCHALTACSDTAVGKYVLFSPVSGTVYLNDAVVADARVERRYHWRWGKKSGTDETRTDKHGRFSMPEITGSSMSAWLPHEPVVEQDIDVYLKDQKYQIWGGARRNYDLNNELGGKAIKIRVELLSNVVEYGNTVGRFTIEQ